jgi:membrane-associated phospholipid phosphatase
VTARPRGAPGGSPALLFAALAVFVLVTADVLAGGLLTRLDHRASGWARATGLPGDGPTDLAQKLVDGLVELGDRAVVGPIVLVAIVVVCLRSRTVGPLVRLVGLSAATTAVVLALKFAVGRHAPSGVHGPEAFRSYPSGHTATAVVLWGLLYTVVSSYPDLGLSRRVAWVLSRIGPVAVMAGLVLRDYHWITDLVGAAALGLVLLQTEKLALTHWQRARGDSAAGSPAARGGRAAAVGPGTGAG